MNELVKQENIVAGYENYFNLDRYEHIGRMANAFAKSDLIPAIFRGKPENCFVAIHLGLKLGIDPLLAMQSIYVVQGNPSISAQLSISLANRCGVFADNIVFTENGLGDDLSVTASATLRSNKQSVNKTVTIKQAHLAGWTNKPVWKTQPAQMLSYRAATQLIRLYAPEAILGMATKEELEDMPRSEIKEIQKSNSPLDMIVEAAKAKHKKKSETSEVIEVETAQIPNAEVINDV